MPSFENRVYHFLFFMASLNYIIQLLNFPVTWFCRTLMFYPSLILKFLNVMSSTTFWNIIEEKKRVIELPYELASVTHLTRITYLMAELKHFSLHRGCAVSKHDVSGFARFFGVETVSSSPILNYFIQQWNPVGKVFLVLCLQ